MANIKTWKNSPELHALWLIQQTLKECCRYATLNKDCRAGSEEALCQAGFRDHKEVSDTWKVFETMLPMLQQAGFFQGKKHWKNLSLGEVKNVLHVIIEESKKENPSPLYRAIRSVYLVAIPTLSPTARMPKWFVHDPIFRQIVCNGEWEVDLAIALQFEINLTDRGIPDNKRMSAERIAEIRNLLPTVAEQAKEAGEQARRVENPLIDRLLGISPDPFSVQKKFLSKVNSPLLTTPETNIEIRNNKEHWLARLYTSVQQDDELTAFFERAQDDPDTFLDIMKIIGKPLIFQLASERLKKDKDYLIRCLQELHGDYRILNYLDEELKTPQFIAKVLNLPVGPVESLDERNILLQLAIGNADPLVQADVTVKNDERFMLEVLKVILEAPLPGVNEAPFPPMANIKVFAAQVGSQLKGNPEFMRKVLQNAGPDLFSGYVEVAYIEPQEAEMAVSAIKIYAEIDPGVVQSVLSAPLYEPIRKLPKFMLGVLEHFIGTDKTADKLALRATFFRAIDPSLKNNKEFMLGVLKICQDDKILGEASGKLRNNQKFIEAAVKINPKSIFVTRGKLFVKTLPLAAYEFVKKALVGLFPARK